MYNSDQNAEQPKIKAGFLILSANLLIINEPMDNPIKNIPSIAENEYVVEPKTKIKALNHATSIAKEINPGKPIAINNQ